MPEPWRTVLEVLLTAFFGLNILMLNSLLKRMGGMERHLQKHEDEQAKTMTRIDGEMVGIRGNYVDRFAEVNRNVFSVKEQLLNELSDIKVSIAKLQEHNERE